MQHEIDLYLFDFDNVLYRYPRDIHDRGLEAAIKVACAYTDLNVAEAEEIILKSWNDHRDSLRLISQLPSCKADIHELNRQFAHVVDYGPNIEPIASLSNGLAQLTEHADVAILSHSTTRFVQVMGEKIGLPSWLLRRNTFGLDRAEYKRKDEPSGVYRSICNHFNVTPKRAMMVEDTAANLKFAKAEGLQTTHIHWGNQHPDVDWIDHHFERTCLAVRTLNAMRSKGAHNVQGQMKPVMV